MAFPKLREFLRRVRMLLRGRQFNREMEEEMRLHAELRERDARVAGADAEEARFAAQRRMGNELLQREHSREAWGWSWLEHFFQDVLFGLRLLWKSPGFTVVAVLTLALGIGANTAIFSLVDGILLRPLPYREPDRLVIFRQSYPSVGLDRWGISQFLFASFREQTRAFARSAAFTSAGLNLTGLEQPVRVQIGQVTEGFFEVLGAAPALGRTFLKEEDVPGKNNVCILSDRIWRRRFGADPNIVGQTLRLNDEPMQVVGVMPAGFHFPAPETDMWVPLGLNPQRRFGFMFLGIARLQPGATAAQAQAETTGIQWNLARQSENPPPEGADLSMWVTPLHEAVTQAVRKPLLVLLGAVGFVVLIACANIANLLLARVAARRREIALRIALGASPGRVVAQLLTESMLLAMLGGAAGAVLAVWLVKLIGRLAPGGIPRMAEVHVNPAALAFTAALAMVTGILFGLAPALGARQIGLSTGLREGVRATFSLSTRRMNHLLVAGQVALSLVLLIGAGLLLKSFAHLLAVNPGFQAENLLTMRLSLAGQRYTEARQRVQFYEALIERVRGLPGVRAAGLVSNLPIQNDGWSDGYVVEGHEARGPVKPNAEIRSAMPGYFHALGIPLLRGRDFSNADRGDSPPVAIVDEALARRYWPDGDALGKRIRYGWDTSAEAWMTIVGVVANVKHNGLADNWRPHWYIPYPQEPAPRMHLAVRTEAEPAAATAAIRAQVRELDANLPVFAVTTMQELVDESLSSQRLTNLLLGAFAATALLLAAIGIYGVMSLSVTGRAQEFGIRMALGAQQSHVFALVLGQGMRIAAAGIVVGVLGAFGVGRVLQTLLFEVSPADPATFAGVAVVLGGTAFAACYLPARRATRVDPIIALRYE